MVKSDFQARMLNLFATVFLVLLAGYALGSRLVPDRHGVIQGSFGVFCALALQSVFQTAFYYLGMSLGAASDVWSLGLTAAVAAAVWFARRPAREKNDAIRLPIPVFRTSVGIMFAVAAALTLAHILRIVAASATESPILTPWAVLPVGTVLWIAVLWLMLLLSILFVRSAVAAAFHAAIAIFAVTSVTPLVYRVGFGFDGFLHAASERILLTTGTLLPKPLYYIGQYVFTTWFSRRFSIPVDAVDRWLVPVLAALLLPLCVYLISKTKKSGDAKSEKSEGVRPHVDDVAEDERASDFMRPYPFLIFLLFPLAPFITTTPQALSYLLSLSALILITRQSLTAASLLFSAWAIAAHPLAGLPVFMIILAVIASRRSRIAAALFVALAGASVPIAFAVFSAKTGVGIQWHLDALSSVSEWGARVTQLSPFIGNRFALWPAWASLAAHASFLLFLLFAVASSATANKRWVLVLTASAIALWVAGAALGIGGDFRFLIEYEREDYAGRLQTLAFFCVVPAALPALDAFCRRLARAPYLIRMAVILVAVLWTSGLAYASFPRHDAVQTGRGWSTGQWDAEAVRLIHADAAGRDYTVLANQSVSAAAVSELGFLRYADDIFFYPIPTGGPLYALYLKMTYEEPTRDTAKDAAALAKSDLVYVVVNKYWWRSGPLTESLRNASDYNWELPDMTDGLRSETDWAVRIYKFDFKMDSNATSTVSGS